MIRLTLSASNQHANIGADGVSEAARMHELARMVADLLPREIFTIHLNHPGWNLSRICAESIKFGPHLHLALHSNALPPARAGQASGTEGWIRRGDAAGLRLAKILLPAVAGAIGLRVRPGREGIAKVTMVDSRGRLAEVDKVGLAPALILESFFHDNPEDIRRYTAAKEAVARAIADSIYRFFNADPKDLKGGIR